MTGSVLLTGSVHGAAADTVPGFRYRKHILSPPRFELTHILVNPPNPYPRWLVPPHASGARSVVLADYQIRAEEEPSRAGLFRVSLWMVPGPFTSAREPERMGEWVMALDFFTSGAVEDFVLRRVFGGGACVRA